MEWDTVIGLEVHAQLKTNSKLFSGASTAFGAAPNTQTCLIDAGLPGVLPVLNQQAVTMAIQVGLALNASINDLSIFERKNYFYPDLPKGYQISQFQKPIVSHGELLVHLPNGGTKTITILRAHLEEDAGKSIHDISKKHSGIDLNRAGTPLLEIVTTPCMNSADEAVAYLKTLHQLLKFLGVCDGNMQEGSFRCDVNISLKPKNSSQLGTRTELKNLNSFRFIEKAIIYEQARHQDLLESGQSVLQETRLYNSDTDSTYPMRSKENENDYRYFPDPDLLPIKIEPELVVKIKEQLPKRPDEIYHDLKSINDLTEDDIQFILSSPDIYHFYQDIKSQSSATDKLVINWLKGHYSAALNDQQLSFETPPVPAALMAKLLDYLQNKKISAQHAKLIFNLLWSGEQDIDLIIQREGLVQSQDSTALKQMILELIQKYPQQVSEYRSGKDKLFGFFVGLMMKQTQGKADPELISDLLKQLLNKESL